MIKLKKIYFDFTKINQINLIDNTQWVLKNYTKYGFISNDNTCISVRHHHKATTQNIYLPYLPSRYISAYLIKK